MAWMFTTAQLPADQATSDEAVRLGHEGLVLYEAGNWGDALARFERANANTYSPVFVLYMARCQHNDGRLLEAEWSLRELLARESSSEVPISWRNAFRDARAELALLHRRIPSLRVTGAQTAVATIDDRPIRLNESTSLNPGEHIVRGRAQDGRISVRRIQLAEGQQDVAVQLTFGSAEATPVKLLDAPRPAVPRRKHDHRAAIWTSGSLALATAILGSVTGIMARSQTNDIRERCGSSSCPGEFGSEVARTRSLANASTALFGVAGVNLGVTLTFLLLPE